MPEAKAVNDFFSRIAARYDRANRVMSSGIDILWRRKQASLVAHGNPQIILDLATGSGDVAYTLLRKVKSAEKIIAMDFCEPMLNQGREKQATKDPDGIIDFRVGDCLNLPLESESVDAITISFGLRNLEDRHKGLTEMLRVLKPGGSLHVLEFTQPWKPVRGLYYWYLGKVIPWVSGRITGHADAYEYLSTSIEGFPTKAEISAELAEAGFQNVTAMGMTASIVALHQAYKKQ